MVAKVKPHRQRNELHTHYMDYKYLLTKQLDGEKQNYISEVNLMKQSPGPKLFPCTLPNNAYLLALASQMLNTFKSTEKLKLTAVTMPPGNK